MRLLGKIRRESADADPPAASSQQQLTADIEQYRRQQREATAKLMNGQRVYDELERAARAFAEEVRRPQKA